MAYASPERSCATATKPVRAKAALNKNFIFFMIYVS